MTLLKSLPAAILLTLAVSGAHAAEPAAQAEEASAPKALTAEQQAQYRKIHDTYVDTVMPLHEQLEGKFIELNALSGVNGVTKEDVSRLVQEIVDLKSKIRGERATFVANLEKAGLPVWGGGMGCMGGKGGMPMMHGGGMGCMGGMGDQMGDRMGGPRPAGGHGAHQGHAR